jgi:hypothetical protein
VRPQPTLPGRCFFSVSLDGDETTVWFIKELKGVELSHFGKVILLRLADLIRRCNSRRGTVFVGGATFQNLLRRLHLSSSVEFVEKRHLTGGQRSVFFVARRHLFPVDLKKNKYGKTTY